MTIGRGIALSINPSYRCNFRCDFCYLSDAQLASTERVSIHALLERLSEVAQHRRIDSVDLYGGEIGILSEDYFEELASTIRLFFDGPINVISNFSVVPRFFEREDLILSASWDYRARQGHENVLKNIRRLGRPVHVLTLASRAAIDLPDEELDRWIDLMNSTPQVASVEIKPYSLNRYHPQDVKFSEIEAWIRKWISRSGIFRFEFINLGRIRESLAGRANAWSDDHLYITPSGRFAVLEFDERGREHFLDLPDVPEYFRWADLEKARVRSNPHCSSCRYLGHCLSEHLQQVPGLEHSCNGFVGLLDWFRGGPDAPT